MGGKLHGSARAYGGARVSKKGIGALGERTRTAFESKVVEAIDAWLRGDGTSRLSEIENKRSLQQRALAEGWHAFVLAERIRQGTLTPETLAKHLDVSEYVLRKTLQDEKCPYTPGDLIHHGRMQIAAEMLRDFRRDRTVHEVSSACNFDDPRRFAIVFAAFWGLTPVEYRKSARELAERRTQNSTTQSPHDSEHSWPDGNVAPASLPSHSLEMKNAKQHTRGEENDDQG
jgi:AraC-like DNA-binding protein